MDICRIRGKVQGVRDADEKRREGSNDGAEGLLRGDGGVEPEIEGQAGEVVADRGGNVWIVAVAAAHGDRNSGRRGGYLAMEETTRM